MLSQTVLEGERTRLQAKNGHHKASSAMSCRGHSIYIDIYSSCCVYTAVGKRVGDEEVEVSSYKYSWMNTRGDWIHCVIVSSEVQAIGVEV